MRRRTITIAATLLWAGLTLGAQSADKELVATISGPTLSRGIVSGLAWDGGTLIIQTVAIQNDGTRSARYFTAAGPRMELRPLPAAPPGGDRYWAMKSSRISPSGIGKITSNDDSKLPMYGIASQERRLLDAMDMGGPRVTHELRLGALLLHRRFNVAPYDGEVWSWSPPELNRVAYVDEKGDLWIAQADGRGAERVLKGTFTLPAWSEDGLVLAIAERKNDGAKWEVSVIHLPEKYRR
jgi:hypothetical protein